MEKCTVILLSLLGYWNCQLNDSLVGGASKNLKMQGMTDKQLYLEKWHASLKHSQIIKKQATRKVKNKKKHNLDVYCSKRVRKNTLEDEEYEKHHLKHSIPSVNKSLFKHQELLKTNKSDLMFSSFNTRHKKLHTKGVGGSKGSKMGHKKQFKIRISRIHNIKKTTRWQAEEGLFAGVAAPVQAWLHHLMHKHPGLALMHFIELAYTSQANNTDAQQQSTSCHLSFKHNIHQVINVQQLFELQTKKVSLAASIIGELLARENVHRSLQVLKSLLSRDDSIVLSSLLAHTWSYSMLFSGMSIQQDKRASKRCRNSSLCHLPTNNSLHAEEFPENNGKNTEAGEFQWGHMESNCPLKRRLSKRQRGVWTVPYTVTLATEPQ